MRMHELDEASILDTIAAKMGSASARGRIDKDFVSSQIETRYKRWLAASSQKPSVDTFVVFLINQMGFSETDVVTIFHKADVAAGNLSPQEVTKISDISAAYAFETGLLKTDEKGKTTADTEKDRNAKFKKQQQQKNHGKSETRPASASAPSGNAKKSQDEENDEIFTLNQSQLSKSLQSVGLSRGHVADLVDILQDTKKFEELKAHPNKNEIMSQLARMGYAIFKTMG